MSAQNPAASSLSELLLESAGRSVRRPPETSVVSALHEMTQTVLCQFLGEMFDKADDILFDSVENARDGTEQRLYLDTMRTVRVQRGRIIESFRGSLGKALSGADDAASRPDPTAAADISLWSLEDGDVLEERLAVSAVESRASALCEAQYEVLRQQLARLAGAARGQVSEESMSPARIVGSFRDAMKGLAVDTPVKLVVYKLFERVVVSRFPELYARAGRLLAEHGIEPPEKAGAGGSVRAAASGSRSMPQAPHASGIPSWAAGFASETVGAFGAHAAAGTAFPAPPVYVPVTGIDAAAAPHAAHRGIAAAPTAQADALLAHEVAQILTSYGEGRQPRSPDWIPPEAVALVARLFDRYYQDPRLPEQFKPILAKLQMPVMKAALSDRSFFSNPQHPARRVIGDLFEMLLQAASATGAAPVPAQSSLLEDLDGLADAVAGAYAVDLPRLQSMQAGPLEEETADAFLRQQEELKRREAETRIERARRTVAHEIRRRIGDAQIDAGAMRMLLSGFGPMLGADYLRGGIDSPSWNASCELIDRLLHSLRPRGSDDDGRADEEARIIAAVTQRLERIGMEDVRVTELMLGLQKSYLELAERSAQPGDEAAEPAPEPQALPRLEAMPAHRELQGLLSILLVPATWYTIYDPAVQSKHWVRVKSFHPARKLILFEHYMEQRFMQLRTEAFAALVSSGEATPIDPSPDLQRAVARIRELAFEPVSDPISWTEATAAPATRH